MICDSCPKAQQNLCDKYYIIKPREECLMRKAQENKSIIKELEKIKEEVEELECLRDNPYNNETEYSVSMEELRELFDKHISELKGE